MREPVTWTRDEVELIELVKRNVEIESPARPISAIGLTGPSPNDAAIGRLSASLQTSKLELAHDVSAATLPLRTALENFARQNGIDVHDQFWMMKAVVAAALQHPEFSALRPTPRKGPKTKGVTRAEADLLEWWIQANCLRAVMEVRLGHTVTNAILADEMARRTRDYYEFHGKRRSEDKEISSAQYYERELNYTKKKAFERLLKNHDFDPPPMRINSTYFTHSQHSASTRRWAPSETEMTETKEWLPRYRKIRIEQLEQAKLAAQR